MKKMVLSALICAMCIATVAQERPVAVQHFNVSFESRHGEAFTVFMDGDLVNRMPQGRVIVNDISQQVHEVVVVLRRPAEKAAVMRLLPGEPNVVVNVDYDAAGGYLHLFTAPCNRPDAPTAPTRRPPIPMPDGGFDGVAIDEMPSHIATDENVDSLVVQLKAVPFDSDRLALARTLLATSLFSSAQIGRLAQTIDYSNSQVEFLKYAYHYCLDPRNYSRAIEVLTFTSDRKKVSDYIATQQ